MKKRTEQLKQRNDDAQSMLPPEERETLTRICLYLSLYPVSAGDLEHVRRELIGMAEEAGARGETLADAIGDEATFCRETAQGLGRANPVERIVDVVRFLAIIVFYIGLAAIHSSEYTVSRGMFFYILLCPCYAFFIARLFTLRRIYASKLQKPLYRYGRIVLFLILVIPAALLLRKWDTPFLTLPTLPTMLVGGLIMLICYLLRRRWRNAGLKRAEAESTYTE